MSLKDQIGRSAVVNFGVEVNYVFNIKPAQTVAMGLLIRRYNGY